MDEASAPKFPETSVIMQSSKLTETGEPTHDGSFEAPDS